MDGGLRSYQVKWEIPVEATIGDDMSNTFRTYCQACGIEADAEILEIDTMEDAIAPLDEQTTRIRELITRYEMCYHEADKEAELIISAIGSGQCPKNQMKDRHSARRN